MTKLEKLKIAASYFPQAEAELDFDSPFQLLIAVLLSAQTTDKAVNKVTVNLFREYPDAKTLMNANYSDIYNIINKIGLAKTKSKNIIATAKIYHESFNDILPRDRDMLISLPGVGIKTANVCLANIYGFQLMAVDTHVERISKRLAITPNDSSVLKVEKTLNRLLKDEDINQFHHSLIFFGRYHCKASSPKCSECLLTNECRYYKSLK